jgi:zeaxanthin glucosyltransferase
VTPGHTVIIGMLQETGHLNPTFKLARALEARGHSVLYTAIPDMEAHVRAQGFETLPWYPDLFPEGFVEARNAQPLFERRRAITARFEALTAQIERSAGSAGQIERDKPSLILADVNEPHLAFLARRLRVPLLLVNTSLPQTKAPGVPPLRAPLSFEAGLRGRLRAELSWQRFLAARRAGAAVASLLGACPPYELARRMAPRFGVSAAELDPNTVYMPQLKSAPEIVLCPECFDFPRPSSPARHYVESIDLERQGQRFDFGEIPESKPIVYCALGGQLYRPRATPEFFQRMLRVFEERPDWHLILSLGRHLRPCDLGSCPPNVTALQSVPQLAVLRRAKLMVTHGGLGSVKECISFGVPMLVIPLAIDQPGNAARVVYHGLGLAGDVERSSVADLRELVSRALTEPSFRAQTARMQQRFREIEDGPRGADTAEGLFKPRL